MNKELQQLKKLRKLAIKAKTASNNYEARRELGNDEQWHQQLILIEEACIADQAFNDMHDYCQLQGII